VGAIILFLLQPFSYYYVWNHKNKHYLFSKFLRANGFITLASVVIFYVFIQAHNTDKDLELYLELQKRLTFFLYGLIAALSLISIGFGFIFKGKKVSYKIVITAVVFSILLPYSILHATTVYSYSTLQVLSNDLKQRTQRDKNLSMPLDPSVASRYPETQTKEEIVTMRTRDNIRRQDLTTLLHSLVKYRNQTGRLPIEITKEWQFIATAEVNLCGYLIPLFIANLPVDPSAHDDFNSSIVSTCIKPYDTKYKVRINAGTRKLELSAPNVQAENELIVSE